MADETLEIWQRAWVASAWVAGLALAGALFAVGVLLVLRSVFGEQSPFRRLTVARRLAPPALLLAASVANRVGLPRVSSLGDWVEGAGRPLVVTIVLASLWLGLRVVRVARDLLFQHFDASHADNLRERRIRTQLAFVETLLDLVLVLAAVALVLGQFSWGQSLGTSLLASAGVASLVVGLGAQKAVGNLIAGFQIAFTQPLRMEDAIVVEGEWGWVEEITLTYVVVRIWDQRRLVLPINYFTEKPFQNWTRTSGQILGSVHLHVSYRAPFSAIESKLYEILDQTPLWDRQSRVLQVVDSTPHHVELRALMTAKDSPTCWELRCWVRRRLLEFLASEHPEALPAVPLQMRQGESVSDAARAGLPGRKHDIEQENLGTGGNRNSE